MPLSKPHDSTASPAAPAHEAVGRWRYPFLFGVQTLGAVILYWNVVPQYRRILADPASHEARPERLVWTLSAIALIQVGYWIRHRVGAQPPRFTNALLGHVLRFVARMAFVLGTSVFAFVFITRKAGFQMPAFWYLVTIVGLFSLYCYTQEWERLGTALMGRKKKPDAPARP